MDIIKKTRNYIRNPKVFCLALLKHYGTWIPNEPYIRIKWKLLHGGKLNLNNPKTFTEKLQWIKLHDHKEVYHVMVDKYDAKEFIRQRLGEDYSIPTIGVYDSFEKIDFSKLPDQFVLKGTFDSGSYYICRDKTKMNIDSVKKKLLVNWNCNYYKDSREWPYQGLKHRIIAEPLISDGKNEYITDLKFFCFNGTPKIVYYSQDISKNACTDFYDMEWNKLHIRMRDPNSQISVEKPKQFEKMRAAAQKLAQGTFFLRVDFFLLEDKFYIGELTFFHCGGFQRVYPEKYNNLLGEWIKLPNM